MSSRKGVLQKFQSVVAGDMTGDITSAVTDIRFLDNIGIQMNWSGTPTGSFSIQVSADYEQDTLGNVVNAGHWVDLTLSPAIVAAGTADQAYADLNQLSAPFIRMVYSHASGTGTLNAFIVGKEV